jgi:hypothetical protein
MFYESKEDKLMIFTVVVAVAAFVAGVLVEKNNAFIGTALVGIKNAVVAVVNYVKSLFAKKS